MGFESVRLATEDCCMSSLHQEDLFRKQAIEALSRKTPGRPICLMPQPWIWLGVLVCLLFVSAAVFAGSAEYARKESVQGWLVSKAGIIRVSARNSAVIREIARQPGDVVAAGDPLVYLSSDATLADGNSQSEEIISQLRQEVLEVDKQLELSQHEQNIEEASLRQQFDRLDGAVVTLASRLADQKRRLALSTEKLRRLESALARGAVSEWDVFSQKEETGVVALDLRRLEQEITDQQGERELLKSRRDSVANQSGFQRSDLRARRGQLLQKIAAQESSRLFVLKSPVSGVVASVEVHDGYSVTPQQLLVTVVPQGAELVAEVFVPSRAAGFIRPGQSVRIAYDAFPQERFGSFDGRVSRVSEYVLLPGEIPQTFSIREATYKTQVSLASSSIETSAGTAMLRPGMLLSADIILEKRNLVDWLLEPLRLRRRSGQ